MQTDRVSAQSRVAGCSTMDRGVVLAAVLAASALLVSEARAHAQEGCPPDHVGCHAVSVDFRHRAALFDDVMLDSGWVPAGSPLQVRFAVALAGSTQVDMGGTAVTSWPAALDVAVPGRPGTGRLAMNYGLEVMAMIRIDVEVAGTRYRWMGDIPLPGGVPSDLRLFDEVSFDPFLLPPREPRSVMVWDDTDPVRVLDVSLTDSLIPIAGIGGGFVLDLVASLETGYRTERIEVSDALTAITEEGASVVVRADPGALELGAAKDYTVLPRGTLSYDATITAIPRLYVVIAGRRFDLGLAEVPLRVVDLDRPTRFGAAEVHVPLPDIRVEPTRVSMGETDVGAMSERLVSVHNEGEATLEVAVLAPRAPFSATATTLTIPARSTTRFALRFEPTAPGDEASVLTLSTNDPDEPLVSIRLSGTGVGAPLPGDAGVADAGWPEGSNAGGCGCGAAGGAGLPTPMAVLLALGVIVPLRTRRKNRM